MQKERERERKSALSCAHYFMAHTYSHTHTHNNILSLFLFWPQQQQQQPRELLLVCLLVVHKLWCKYSPRSPLPPPSLSPPSLYQLVCQNNKQRDLSHCVTCDLIGFMHTYVCTSALPPPLPRGREGIFAHIFTISCIPLGEGCITPRELPTPSPSPSPSESIVVAQSF